LCRAQYSEFETERSRHGQILAGFGTKIGMAMGWTCPHTCNSGEHAGLPSLTSGRMLLAIIAPSGRKPTSQVPDPSHKT
jgi:hypothetical protein